MNRRLKGMTRIEAIMVLGVGIILMLIVLGNFVQGPARPEAQVANCKEALSQIGKAAFNYSQDHSEYYPFAWDTCDQWRDSGEDYNPAAMGRPYVVRADVSLGLLYPKYFGSASIFRCASTEDEPFIETSVPTLDGIPIVQLGEDGRPDITTLRPGAEHLWGKRTHTLKGSSYGYDARIDPRAPARCAVAGDMDGSWAANPGRSTANHKGGQNVLYFDGHVGWDMDNNFSDDPQDNIFSEDPWSADTDSYLVRATAILGKSYDGYPELQRNP